MFVCTCADVCTWVCYAITGVQICDRITCTMRARKASLCMRFKRDLVARGCFRTKKKKKNDGQRSQMAGTLSNSTHKFVRQYKVHVTLRTRCYRKNELRWGHFTIQK